MVSLLTFTTSHYQKPRLKINSRAIRALGLLKVLQNHLKFLKNTTPKNEETYKTYKSLFETIKKSSKKKFDSEILHKFKGTLMKFENLPVYSSLCKNDPENVLS